MADGIRTPATLYKDGPLPKPSNYPYAFPCLSIPATRNPRDDASEYSVFRVVFYKISGICRCTLAASLAETDATLQQESTNLLDHTGP